MQYLSAEEILVIHFELIDSTEGLHGVRDIGLLESIAHKPKAKFGGKELYGGIFKKAAAYFESLAQYHVFIDGNKRTAVAVSARFLFQNGYELTASNKAIEKFAINVAIKKYDIESVATWIRRHSSKATNR